MSKLKKIFSKLSDNRGSTLVAVVVFGIVLTIAGTGYLHVMSNTVSHEITALDDEKAYQTAESGLLMGIRWLRLKDHWDNRTGYYGQKITTISQNGMTCDITLEEENGNPVVTSTVSGGSLTYEKILRFTATSNRVELETLINNNPINATGSGGEGGFLNVVFDGPFHLNEAPLIISSNGDVFFNDDVTVFNGIVYNGNYGIGRNDYNYGLKFTNSGHPSLTTLDDEMFKKSYEYNQDSLYLPDVSVNDDEENGHIMLPKSAVGEFTGDIPFVYYLPDGTARYYHYGENGLGDPEWGVKGIPEGSPIVIEYDNIEDSIMWAENPIGVLGTVKGNKTLGTKVASGDRTITLLGDITYESYNPSILENYGIPLKIGIKDNDDLLTLVSEGDIKIGYWGEKNDPIKVMTFTDDPLFPGKLKPKEDDGEIDTMLIQASLIAKEEGHGLIWKMTGDGKQISGKYEFVLKAVGDRIVDEWDNFGPSNQNPESFFYDIRLDGTLQGRGIPYIVANLPTDEIGYVLTGTWSEENK